MLVNTSRYQNGDAPQFQRDKILYSGPSQNLPYVSIHLATCVLYFILYYMIKLVPVSSCFPEFHELFLKKKNPRERRPRDIQFVVKMDRRYR